MTDKIIKYALHTLTQEIIFIDNAIRGGNCNCTCIKCKEDLIAVKGDKNEWHFRHSSDSNCNGGQETALHQFAKQVIVKNTCIKLPEYGQIIYSDAIAEKELVSRRPDVTVTMNGKQIYFEIAVKHFIEPDKNLFFINGKHKSVEIDLSDTTDILPEEIENIILNQTGNKRIIFWEEKKEETEIKKNHGKRSSWFEDTAAVALIFSFFYFVCKILKSFFKKNKYKYHDYR